MHVCAVACIDDRHWCHLAGILGCSLDEMAHGNHIGIVAVFDPSYTAMKGMRALVTRRIHNATSSIVVTGNAGSVTIQGAQGETAYVRNLLGMPLAETVVTSDNATIAVPAGIVLVTVGDETVKVVVK